MLNVTIIQIMPSVVRMNVILLSVMAPIFLPIRNCNLITNVRIPLFTNPCFDYKTLRVVIFALE